MTWTKDFFFSKALVLSIVFARAIGSTEAFETLLLPELLPTELLVASIILDKFSTDVATDFVYSESWMDGELSR